MGKDLKGREIGTGITQRKDGTFQARYVDRWGKRKTIYGKNLKKLRKELATEVADNETYSSVRDEVKLDAWFDRWMETYKERSIRPNTKRTYVDIYKRNISPYIGGRNINSLVKSDIQAVIDTAHDLGYKYERQDKIKVILKDMMQRALEDDLIRKNPVSGVKLRADKPEHKQALTREQQEEFFDCCRGTFYDNLFNVAVNTGLRPGELFALQLSDINLEEGYIDVNKTLVYQKYLTDEKKTFHIEPPKTKQSYRKVPINSECRKYLEKQMNQKKAVAGKWAKEQNDYLFTTKFNTPLNSVIYSDAIKSIVKQINLTRAVGDEFPVFSGHVFRHTFATRCFESGVDAKVVQAYLGHASIKMTMDLYTHVTDEKSSLEIEKIVPGKSEGIIEFRRKMA